jgi:single-strand DNA-binding protein
MSEGLNRAFLLGNLGADPELRFTSGGSAVLKLRLATTRGWLDRQSNTRKEATQWHSVQIWGKRAEALAKILCKGGRVFVEGAIETNKADTPEGPRYYTQIVAQNIILLGGSTRVTDAGEPAGYAGQQFEGSDRPDDDDIPF